MNRSGTGPSLPILIASMLACAGPADGQVRADGMAGAGSALLTGVDAPALNPARLTARGGARVLVGEASFAASNSSFTVADYRDYNGERLTDEDEEDILARVRGDRVDAAARGGARSLSVRVGGFAVSTRVRGRADTRVPKDLLRLALDGNSPGETFDLNGAHGAGYALAEAAVSYARAMDVNGGPFSLGASLKLIRGIGYADVVRATGDLATTQDGVSGSGELAVRTARGGWGYGADFGAWRAVSPEWSLSLSALDLGTSIRWNQGAEERTTTFLVRDATLEDLEDDTDDLVDEKTVSRPIGEVAHRIGPTVVAGAAWSRGRTTLAADLRKSFERGPSKVARPLASVGGELDAAPWLTLRAGIGIGGWDDVATAFGLSVSPGPIRIDAALLAPGGVLPFKGRGVGAGISIGLE